MRLRNMRLVGLRKTSPSDTVGNSMRQAAGGEHAALDGLHAARAWPGGSCCSREPLEAMPTTGLRRISPE
jgi:hypothetical protein